jgi:hypothetical protein
VAQTPKGQVVYGLGIDRKEDGSKYVFVERKRGHGFRLMSEEEFVN